MQKSTKQKKLRGMYELSCLFLLAITGILLILAILFSFGVSIDWKGVLVTILLALGGILTGIGGFMGIRQKNLAKLFGKWGMHFGLVIVLAGFGLFEVAGETVNAAVPVGGDTYYANIQRENGDICQLGFHFRITDFSIDYHEDGSEKMYRAGIEFADAVSLRVDREELAVNRTVEKNGWKIYLMSYTGDSVNLLFRRDPGETVVKAGMWITIAGTVLSLLCGTMLCEKKEGTS